MTNLDLLHEATQEDKSRLAAKINPVKLVLEQEKFGATQHFDQTLSQVEVTTRLNEMRKQTETIVAWFNQVYARSKANGL